MATVSPPAQHSPAGLKPTISASVSANSHLDEKDTFSVDQLFEHRNVREIEAYASNVLQQARTKQQAVRTLVGDRFRDLLGISRTVVDMHDHLVALRETLEALQRASEHMAEQHANRGARGHVLSSNSYSSEIPHAAVLLLITDAPIMIRNALRAGSFLQAAWAMVFATKAWHWLHTSDHTELVSILEPQWTDIQSLRDHVLGCIDTSLQNVSVRTSVVLDTIVAYTLLEQAPINKALEHVHAQRVKAAATCCSDTAPLSDRVSRLVRVVVRTLSLTRTLWARPVLSRVLTRLSDGNAFFRLGTTACDLPSSFAPAGAANLYEHMPLAIQTCEAAAGSPTLKDDDIHLLTRAFVQRVCTELDAVPNFLANEHDLDVLAQSRHSLKTLCAASNVSEHLGILETHLLTLLDARVRTLLQHTLADVPSAFAAELQRMNEASVPSNALQDLFSAQQDHVHPTHWRTYRAPSIESCLSLVEARIGQTAHSMDVVAAPVHTTCLALIEQLQQVAQADALSIEQMHRLLRVCLAMHTSPVLTKLANKLFFERLADVYMALSRRWARSYVDYVLSLHQEAMPSLLKLAHALHTLGPNPLSPPPLWEEWVLRSQAKGFAHTQDPEPAAFTSVPAYLDAMQVDPACVRLMLAPWVPMHSRAPASAATTLTPSSSSLPSPSPIQQDDASHPSPLAPSLTRRRDIARIAPRFSSW